MQSIYLRSLNCEVFHFINSCHVSNSYTKCVDLCLVSFSNIQFLQSTRALYSCCYAKVLDLLLSEDVLRYTVVENLLLSLFAHLLLELLVHLAVGADRQLARIVAHYESRWSKTVGSISLPTIADSCS